MVAFNFCRNNNGYANIKSMQTAKRSESSQTSDDKRNGEKEGNGGEEKRELLKMYARMRDGSFERERDGGRERRSRA